MLIQTKMIAAKVLALVALLCVSSSISFAQRRAPTPEVIVRNLYSAHKSRATDPFFQTKRRVFLDAFFAKGLADLIWNDAVTSARNKEVGKLDGDPLYNAQDMKITAFRIKPPMYGEGNLDLADVPVTFKNFGKEQTVLFRLERDQRRVWRITDIFYPNNPDTSSSLSKILSAAQ